MAANLFKQESTHLDYVERFFKGHDHPRLSWLYHIGQGHFGTASSTLLSMTDLGGGGNEILQGKEDRIGPVSVSVVEACQVGDACHIDEPLYCF